MSDNFFVYLRNSSWFLFMNIQKMPIWNLAPLTIHRYHQKMLCNAWLQHHHYVCMHALQDNSMESFLVGPSSHPINVECILNHLNSFLLVFELPSTWGWFILLKHSGTFDSNSFQIFQLHYPSIPGVARVTKEVKMLE